MWRRVQFRLALLLIIVSVAVLTGLFAFQRGEQRRMRGFFERRVAEQAQVFQGLVELSGRSLEMFAFDYTYWNEMVRSIEQADRGWADENVAEALGTYKTDAAWMFRPDRGLVYQAQAEGRDALAGFVLPESLFAPLLEQSRFCHFFVESPAGLMEVRGATVHPSDDPERTSPVQGYFLVGRLWDKAHLGELARLFGGEARLVSRGQEPARPDAEAGLIAVSRELPDWQGRPLARVEARMVSYAVLEFDRSSVRQFAVLVLMAGLSIGIVVVGIALFVTRPLNRLSRSLRDEDAGAIGGLTRSRTEFGQLARLVTHFFEQKAQLVREVAQRQQAMEALELKEAELERSNRELEQFAYVASHDLQEPLRMVGSYTQLLARRYKGRLDADADEFIAFAVDGVTRMQRLISDLLQFSRVGTRGKAPAPTDAAAVFERTLRSLAPAIEESGATVTCDRLPEVMADEVQLEQLLQNLVGNAIKYHGPEPPQVHVRAERSNGAWMFSVRDNGIGVEPEYHERIFQIFQRLHTRGEYEGTGIGLAVCKKIVERHGGRIWVESRLGGGADFRFTLPAVETEGRSGE